MENNYVMPVSSLKLDSTAKGLVTLTWHIYKDTTEEALDTIRKQTIDQFIKTVAELEGISNEEVKARKFTTVVSQT